MLQRVSFPVGGRQIVGVLHLSDRAGSGSAVVLHGFGGHAEQPHIVATCEALAASGTAALRFPYRDHDPPRMTLDTGLEDARAAVRLLRAHPQVPRGVAVVGFSFGGAVAAMLAGGDRQIRAAVLAAPPASFSGDDRPARAIAKTRAKVLLLWGTRDTVVPLTNAEAFEAMLAKARVEHHREMIEGGDHDFAPAVPRRAMTEAVADFLGGGPAARARRTS